MFRKSQMGIECDIYERAGAKLNFLFMKYYRKLFFIYRPLRPMIFFGMCVRGLESFDIIFVCLCVCVCLRIPHERQRVGDSMGLTLHVRTAFNPWMSYVHRFEMCKFIKHFGFYDWFDANAFRCAVHTTLKWLLLTWLSQTKQVTATMINI